jgi:hypothetical protein
MDMLDVLAFWGRKYERQRVASSRSTRFSLGDVLEMFDRNALLELTPYVNDDPVRTFKPDAVKKVKVSLLDDGISAIHSSRDDWYEVYRTAPSGELSKVKIVAHSPGGPRIGEIRMLVGQRTYEHYFKEDPIFAVGAGLLAAATEQSP